MESQILNNNSLAFIALCNEYCFALENARSSERADFIASMLRLLPRIYIAATDLDVAASLLSPEDEDLYIESYLDEDYYDAIRRDVERLMGPDDVYLEVFEEDMKYSDTPISASVAENLADIFQSVYNFTEMVKNAPTHMLPAIIHAMREDFRSYWSRLLCNVMRALNHVRYAQAEHDDDCDCGCHHHHDDDDCDCGCHHHDGDCDCGPEDF